MEQFGLMMHTYNEIKQMLIGEYRAIDALDKAYQEFEFLQQKARVWVSKYKRDLEESADRFNKLVTEAKGLKFCRLVTGDTLALKFKHGLLNPRVKKR